MLAYAFLAFTADFAPDELEQGWEFDYLIVSDMLTSYFEDGTRVLGGKQEFSLISINFKMAANFLAFTSHIGSHLCHVRPWNLDVLFHINIGIKFQSGVPD